MPGVIFEAGRQVQQRNNGRIWTILGPATDRYSASGEVRRRWLMEIAVAGTRDDRYIGDRTNSTETWVNDNCDPWPPHVAPPVGVGEQVVRIRDGNDLILAESVFPDAVSAVQWLTSQLLGEYNDDDNHAAWYGWVPDDIDAEPDLIAMLGDDNAAILWQEVG
jgi:hypothetical protein